MIALKGQTTGENKDGKSTRRVAGTQEGAEA